MAGMVGQQGVARVQELSFGPRILPDGEGTLFRLWAPTARSVQLILNEKTLPMQEEGDGWYVFLAKDAGPGTLYQFRVNDELNVPDPAARFQPEDVHGRSQVVDPARFSWRDAGWKGRPWQETILYELHVGTFTPEGTFRAVKDKLDHLVDLGITAIELMPVSDFPGSRNWGYDGVLHFAPDSRYGTPEDLKDLVQAAHGKGLMVFLDVVYNHFGPEGNYLHAYAEDFFTGRYHTPWGAAINFEGPRWVREFFIQNALYWLNEYHFDGLRLDAVHAICDRSEPHFLTELAQRVRAGVAPDRHVHLVLENDANNTRYLTGEPQKVFTAQWNDDIHHAMHVLLSGDTGGYYGDYTRKTSPRRAIEHLGRCLTEGFAYQGDPSPYRGGEIRGERSDHLHPLAFVNFLQNHDQIGNRAFGDRLLSLTTPQAMRAALAVFLLAPGVPLLYMGEEWQTEKPFLFFCDFGGDLAPLVTEGRRKEFAQFPEFSDPQTRERIPDPAAPGTFEASRLDWAEAALPTQKIWLTLYKNLLTIRQRDMVPRIARMPAPAEGNRRYQAIGDTGLLAEWRQDNGKTLYLAANLGPEPLTFDFADQHNRESGLAEPLYESENGAAEQLLAGGMPAWSVVWFEQ